MRIIQIIGCYSYGDGMGNCVTYLSRLFDRNGISNLIAASSVDERLSGKKVIEFSEISELEITADTVVMYHFGSGSELNYQVEHMDCRKILVYHNVTPPEFFRGTDTNAMITCLWGVQDARETVGNYLHAIVLSELSKRDLIGYGWDADKVDVIPLISIEKKQVTDADPEVVKRFKDKRNILFVGRVARNKKFEDVLRVFSYYKTNYEKDSNLIFVGSKSDRIYYQALLDYIRKEKIEDVFFLDHISDQALNAFYSCADVFLCMSEHEGFCLPIMEAMQNGVPVVAYAAAAIPDTMGNAGVQAETKDPKEISEIIDRITHDEEYRTEIVDNQYVRANEINVEHYSQKIMGILREAEETDSFEYRFKNSLLDFEHAKLRIEHIEKYGYDLGTKLSLKCGNDHIYRYVLYGLSNLEEHGCWTDGNDVAMLFSVDAGKIPEQITLNLEYEIFSIEQTVKILVNDNEITEYKECLSILDQKFRKKHIFKRSVSIPGEIIDSVDIKLQLMLPDAVSPEELNVSDDVRKLALYIRSVELCASK